MYSFKSSQTVSITESRMIFLTKGGLYILDHLNWLEVLGNPDTW